MFTEKLILFYFPANKNLKDFKNLKDTRDKKVVMLLGSTIGDESVTKYDFSLEYVKTIEQAFLMLKNGRADFVACGETFWDFKLSKLVRNHPRLQKVVKFKNLFKATVCMSYFLKTIQIAKMLQKF